MATCACGGNGRPMPQIPAEIVGMILLHLRPTELHSCRLVSKTWNEVCLKILKKPNHHHYYHLPSTKLSDYVKFARETNANIFTPFHITISPNAVGGVIIRELDYLLQLAGPESISALEGTLDFVGRILLRILEMVSPGLKSLFLSNNLSPTSAGQIFRQTPPITFPKLEKLECHNLKMECEIKFIDALLSRCPVLQDLKVTGGGLGYRGGSEIQIPFQNLTSLCLREFRHWHWPTLVHQIRNLTPPMKFKLEHLELDCDVHNGDVTTDRNAELVASMAKISPTLKTFVYCKERGPPKFRFSSFPKLEYLEIRTKEMTPGFWNTVDINFIPELLPLLKSIKIPLSLSLTELTGQRFVFPSVTSVVVNVNVPKELDFQLHTNTSQITKFVDNMFFTFPNITRLGLDMSSVINDRQGAHIIAMITRIIKSPKSANILKFEMKSFEFDYLGEALYSLDMEYRPKVEIQLKEFNTGSISPDKAKAATLKFMQEVGVDSTLYECMNFTVTGPSHSCPVVPSTWNLNAADKDKGHHMKTIQAIRLKNSKWRGRRVFDVDHANLSGYVKHFPNLRVLELSPSMVASGRGLKQIRDKFKDLTINICE